MSENSDSYHLRTEDQQLGIDLLQRAGLKGFVLPATNGWVSLVAEGKAFEPNEKLIDKNKGLLLHYSYAEEFGWGFELYDHLKVISQYNASWIEGLDVSPMINIEDLAHTLNPSLIETKPDQLSAIFNPPVIENIVQGPPAPAFADLIGLNFFSWLSYEYYFNDHRDQLPLPEGTISVD